MVKPCLTKNTDGSLYARCVALKCAKSRGAQPILNFTPAASNSSHKKRKRFNDLTKNSCESTNYDEIQSLRTSLCLHCRAIQKKSQTKGSSKISVCKAAILELQRLAKESGCVTCGGTESLEFQHVDPATKMRKNGKPVSLSDYVKWATLGGVEAIHIERQKCVVMCRNCHRMDPTFIGFKAIASSSLPNVSQYQDASTYRKKHALKIKEEKQDYVDSIKLNLAECKVCNVKLVPKGTCTVPGQSYWPWCFDFAHNSELKKGDNFGKNGTVSLLAASRAKLSSVKSDIDRETNPSRSRLLCANCHHQETVLRRTIPGEC